MLKRTETELTHFPQEQTCQIKDKLCRCHRVQIVVSNEKNLDAFSTVKTQD